MKHVLVPFIALALAGLSESCAQEKAAEPNATLFAADRFLVQHGLLTGEPTLAPPKTGGKRVPAVKSKGD